MENKIACKKCIREYKIPKRLLGKDGETCWWCCALIRDKPLKPIDKNKYPKEMEGLIEHINKVNSGDKEEIKKIVGDYNGMGKRTF